MKVTRIRITDTPEIEGGKMKPMEYFWSIVSPSEVISVVELGTITKPAQLDEEGNVVVEAEVLEGYHVDVKSKEVIPSLNDFIVVPNAPVHGRRWAEGCDIVTQESY